LVKLCAGDILKYRRDEYLSEHDGDGLVEGAHGGEIALLLHQALHPVRRALWKSERNDNGIDT
jgi:hypothetical protein